MKIERIKIENFKSLRSIDIALSNLTLITGVNSSGKSSVIQTLLLLKQNAVIITRFLNHHLFLSSFQKNSKELNEEESRKHLLQEFILEGEYISFGDKTKVLYQEVHNEPISIGLYVQNFFMITQLDKNFKPKFLMDKKKINAVKELIEFFLDEKYFHYISTDRINPKISYPLSEKHIRKNLLGIGGEYTPHYLAKNRHKPLPIEKLKHPASKTIHLLENVSAWLSEISKGIEVSATVYHKLQSASLSYQYVYGENRTSDYIPQNVGFGITYVLPILVAILKSSPGEMLILENPESHLHPAGQSKIAELCAIAANAGVQIIVESHSDHFLNAIRVAVKKGLLKPEESQIYYFYKKYESLETIAQPLNIDENGRIDDWPQGFFDEWDNKLNDLLK